MRKVIITNIMNELIDINVGICFLNPLSLINKGVIIPSAMKLINTTPTYSKYITGVDCHDKLWYCKYAGNICIPNKYPDNKVKKLNKISIILGP